MTDTARTDVKVAVSLDVTLTADQLATLSDDQTANLFRALRAVAVLTEKARANTRTSPV